MAGRLYWYKMRDFRKLKVWVKAHRFTLGVYQITRNFPDHERFGLTSQLRRSAVSISSNIAEGCGRIGDKELARFLSISTGSANEAEYQLLLAYHLKYVQLESYQSLDCLINEVKRMLIAFIQKLAVSRKL